ncbi:PKD domain-containing protein, partial [Acidobacteriota bacterium]
YSPENPRIGEQVTFTANNFLSTTLIRWDFGDGTIENDNSPPTVTHTFNQAGNFQVRAYDDGGAIANATVNIQIHPAPTLSFMPSDPRTGEQVTFSANNFFSTTLIRWDFGDGTIENDSTPPTIQHTYNNGETYQVRAFDNGGTIVTASTILSVRPPHIITYNPQPPLTGEPIIFQAINFTSSVIQWDFGDGTPIQQSSAQTSHVFQNEGTYTLVATDTRDGLPFPVTSTITVRPDTGPTSPFSISYINLRFEDGLSYKVVQKDFSPLVAYADIKYEGTGILVAQWLIDGNPFRMVSETLVQAEDFVFDSGNIPGLPTLSPGIHEVTLNIFQPITDFDIPIIQYYVSVQPRGKIQKLGTVDLTKIRAIGLGDEDITISKDTIVAPLDTPFLLQGTVQNENQTFVPRLLLRVYLDDRMTDQKLLGDIEAGKDRPFETSISIPSIEAKKIYIKLFDISGETPSLIYEREWNILIQGP